MLVSIIGGRLEIRFADKRLQLGSLPQVQLIQWRRPHSTRWGRDDDLTGQKRRYDTLSLQRGWLGLGTWADSHT